MAGGMELLFFGLWVFEFRSLKFGENRSFCGFQGFFSGNFGLWKIFFRTLENGHSIHHHQSIPPLTKCRPICKINKLVQLILLILQKITLQCKYRGLVRCKNEHTTGSSITKKILWWHSFCKLAASYLQSITKENVPRRYFAKTSARMVRSNFSWKLLVIS